MLLSFHLIKFPKIIKWEMSFSAQNEVNSYYGRVTVGQWSESIFYPGFAKADWLNYLKYFFLDETKMEFMPSPMSAAPLTPPASVGKYFFSLQNSQIFLF